MGLNIQQLLKCWVKHGIVEYILSTKLDVGTSTFAHQLGSWCAKPSAAADFTCLEISKDFGDEKVGQGMIKNWIWCFTSEMILWRRGPFTGSSQP